MRAGLPQTHGKPLRGAASPASRRTLVRPAAIALLALAPMLAMARPLVVCTEGSPDGFDVVRYNSLITTNASADVIFNTLVTYDPVAKQIEPSLALRWDLSADGRTYTFHLRPGVAFQTTPWFRPTRALDADDVVFTFDRMLDPANPWHQVAGPGGFPHAQSMGLTKHVKSVTRVDDLTVRFVLDAPDATFVPTLSMGFASIYSAEYAAQLLKAGRTADLNEKPVGTGPFELHSYVRDAVIRYTANPAYWGPKPKTDKLIYAITPDAAVRVLKLKADECAIALSPRPEAISAARTNPALQVIQTPAFMTAFVAINTQKKPLGNPQVRTAINLAFDRDAYLKAVFEGTAAPAVNPFPPNTWGYANDIAAYPHDPARARQLLAQAGYPHGFATTIWTRPTGSSLNPDPQLGAQMLQADLAKIGIQATIRVIEWGELIKEAKRGQHDLLFMGWAGDNGDPDNFLSPQFSCGAVKSGINFARYCNATLDKLISDARASSDRARRTRDYEQAQHIIHDQALWIPLGYPVATALVRAGVSGYRANPFGRQDFSTVSVPERR